MAPRWLARCSDSKELADAIKRHVVQGLAKSFPRAGWLYVMTNPSWNEGTIKFGMTKCIRARIAGYNSSNQTDVRVSMAFVCTDIVEAENRLKTILSDYRIDDTRIEWVSSCPETVKSAVESTLEKDEALSEAARTPIFRCIQLPSESEPSVETKETILPLAPTGRGRVQPPRKGNSAECGDGGGEAEVNDSEMDRDSFFRLSLVESGRWIRDPKDLCPMTPVYIPEVYREDESRPRKKAKTVIRSDLPRVPGLTQNGGSWVAKVNGGESSRSFSMNRYGVREAYDLALGVLGERKDPRSKSK